MTGAAARTAAVAYSRAWHRSRTKVVFRPGRISSQTVRIRGAPSDSTTTSSAASTPFRCVNCARRAANSEARPAPSADRALSMRTPAAPFFQSVRGSPVFGSGRSTSRQTTAFASLVFAESRHMAQERRLRNLHAGEILQLADRLPAAVGTGDLRAEAVRPGRGRPALQTQRPVQREGAAAALAAMAAAPLDPDRTHARLEGLSDPAVPFHPPAAARAGRRRKLGVERLQKGRVARRPAPQLAAADRGLDGVRIRNPAAPELRRQKRKQTTELRFRRPHERSQRARPGGRTAGRLDLATANPAPDALLLNVNAVALSDNGRMLRRLRVRQSLQLRHRIRMEKLRVPSLDRHAGLFRSSPDARRPPCAGLRKPPPGHVHAEPRRPRLLPSETPKSDRARKHKTDFTKKYGPHPHAKQTVDNPNYS